MKTGIRGKARRVPNKRDFIKTPTPTPCGGTPFVEGGGSGAFLKPPSTKEVDAAGGRRLGLCPAGSDTKQFLGFSIKGSKALWLLLFSFLLFSSPAFAASFDEVPRIPIPLLELSLTPADGPQDVAMSLQIIALMTVLSLAPAILLMLTSFTRIAIVLGFIQRSIGLQQTPPQQVITGLALFLTLYTMYPTWNQIYEQGLSPYMAGSASAEQAWTETITPVREFMFRYTRQEELSLMVSMANLEEPENQDAVPTRVLVPAFMLSELKTAFQMGVVIYIPFIVVDMVVSSVLLAMGMMMLPPMMISLPFKILLFVMADGWNLVILSLLKSFLHVG